MGLAAFNRARRTEASAQQMVAERHDNFVAMCEAKGLDAQLMSWGREELEVYALNTYGVKLDGRKNFEKLVRDVMALEDAADDAEADAEDGIEVEETPKAK